MEVIEFPSFKDIPNILSRPAQDLTNLRDSTLAVIEDIQANGDKAVVQYTAKFDGVNLDQMLVAEEDFALAEEKLKIDLKKAIEVASVNIKKFHAAQKQPVEKVEIISGVECWRKSVGIENVGLYVPGGTAPLFSSVLMLGIPAKLAGCKRIILCTPPNKEGKIHPAILYAAKCIGLTEVYKVGGIQAIAAMTFGTETIPKVSKIFGPGNAYVTAAKQLVSNMGVAIDMPAGPSEVMVLADDSCVPSFVAADLLSQAEHGVDSQVVFVTNSKDIIVKVEKEIEQQISQLSRAEMARKSLSNSKIVLVKDSDSMIDIANIYAPEHLIISTRDADSLAEKVINAGSVFIGNYSPESAGDYASGTNHALPTAGYATSYSGVSLDSFVKKITFQKLSKEGVRSLGKTIEVMAEAEGLTAHKNAVSLRITD
jgi:histidinol dehydrogenase